MPEGGLGSGWLGTDIGNDAGNGVTTGRAVVAVLDAGAAAGV